MLNEKNTPDRSAKLLQSFWDLQRQFMKSVQYTATTNDLSIPEYSVLMKINHHEKMTQKQVGEKNHLPKSTLSQAVEGLVQSEVLQRQHVEGNRRCIQLLLTNKGKSLMDHIDKQSDGTHQIFYGAVESLTAGQFNELISAHEQITTYFKKQGSEKHAQNS